MAEKINETPPAAAAPEAKPPVEAPKEQPAEPVLTEVTISKKELTKLIEEADEKFAHIGGSKYEYVQQVLLPLLAEKGYVIAKRK